MKKGYQRTFSGIIPLGKHFFTLSYQCWHFLYYDKIFSKDICIFYYIFHENIKNEKNENIK